MREDSLGSPRLVRDGIIIAPSFVVALDQMIANPQDLDVQLTGCRCRTLDDTVLLLRSPTLVL